MTKLHESVDEKALTDNMAKIARALNGVRAFLRGLSNDDAVSIAPAMFEEVCGRLGPDGAINPRVEIVALLRAACKIFLEETSDEPVQNNP